MTQKEIGMVPKFSSDTEVKAFRVSPKGPHQLLFFFFGGHISESIADIIKNTRNRTQTLLRKEPTSLSNLIFFHQTLFLPVLELHLNGILHTHTHTHTHII